METNEILDMLRAGGSFDIQTYKVGTGGLTRVNIQPASRGGDRGPLTITDVIGDFFGGLILAGVVAFVVAMIVMIFVAVSHDGTTNSGVPNSLIATCFYCWVGVTLLGGVVAGVWTAAAKAAENS